MELTDVAFHVVAPDPDLHDVASDGAFHVVAPRRDLHDVASDGAFHVVAPDRDRHLPAMADLVARTFPRPDAFWMRRRCLEWSIGGVSHYDWKAARVGLLGERLVTHFGVWDMPVRIGSAVVRCAGVGMVATHGDFQHQGLMARTADAALAAMAAAGYDISILFGIPGYYDRYGYTPAWTPETHITQTVLTPLGRGRGGLRLRKTQPVAREDLDGLYNGAHATATGTVVRPTYRQGFSSAPWEGVVWGPGGRAPAEGYLFFRQEGQRLVAPDGGGDPERVMQAAANLARERMLAEIEWPTVHYHSPLGQALRDGQCRTERTFHPNAGPMIRTLSLGGTLKKLCPVLTRRMRQSPLAQSGEWTLLARDGRESARLSWREGRIRLEDNTEKRPAKPKAGDGAGRMDGRLIAKGDLGPLLLGAWDTAETARRLGLTLSGAAATLAPVLFPNEHPMMNRLDQI